MPDEKSSPGEATDLGAARVVLRAELVARGHSVASDTMGLKSDLYIIGPNDLATALFVFSADAETAAESMYRGSGSWVSSMPPRFAVLPSSESDSPALEVLEQMRAIPLMFESEGDRLVFPDLNALLDAYIST